MYPFFGRDGTLFIAGAGTGAFVVMSMVTFQLLDPIGARLYSGLEGETSTSNCPGVLGHVGHALVNAEGGVDLVWLSRGSRLRRRALGADRRALR